MLHPSKLLSAAILLALTGCAAQQGQYQPTPRPQLDPLPADLRLTSTDRALCQRLLLMFSASPQTLQDSCGDMPASSKGSKNAGP